MFSPWSAVGLCFLATVSGLYKNKPIQNMTIVHTWNYLEYGFENLHDYQYVIETGLYKESGFKRAYDVELFVDDHKRPSLFLSTPKAFAGIPYSLARVSNRPGKYGLLLEPYPNFKAHSPRETPDCRRIISIFRMFIDSCGRLWAIDSGYDYQQSQVQVCPPKLLIYDLTTNQLVFNYTIPDGQYIPGKSVYNGISVDVYDPPPKGKCADVKAYITDAVGCSLIVFDLKTSRSWVIVSDHFKPETKYSTTTIAGDTFQIPYGVYTSTPFRRRNSIYLHSLASVSEISAQLSIINNMSYWLDNPTGHSDVFKVIGTRKTQTTVQTVDRKGHIYFYQSDPLSIRSWFPGTPYNDSWFETMVENSETLKFLTGLKVKHNTRGEEVLLVLSNPLPKLNTGSTSLEKIDYRIMVCTISTLWNRGQDCGSL